MLLFLDFLMNIFTVTLYSHLHTKMAVYALKAYRVSRLWSFGTNPSSLLI